MLRVRPVVSEVKRGRTVYVISSGLESILVWIGRVSICVCRQLCIKT